MLFKEDLFLLVDSNSLLHRAFHALPPLFDKKGEPTQAIYGTLRMLFKVLREFSPKYIASAFDLPVPTFREAVFKEYKAQRPKIAEDLKIQIEKSKEVFQVFGIPVFQKPGFEADDIIGTISRLSLKENPNLEILILSGDLDLLQLVSDKIFVYTFKKGVKEEIIYTLEKVKQRFGLKPEQLLDLKSLKGDPSDNIPGVKGIGEKTAIFLLQKFGSLEEIYNRIDEALRENLITERQYRLLREQKDQAFFSKELVKIREDLKINFSLKNCAWRGYNKERAKRMLSKLGFKSLLNSLP